MCYPPGKLIDFSLGFFSKVYKIWHLGVSGNRAILTPCGPVECTYELPIGIGSQTQSIIVVRGQWGHMSHGLYIYTTALRDWVGRWLQSYIHDIYKHFLQIFHLIINSYSILIPDLSMYLAIELRWWGRVFIQVPICLLKSQYLFYIACQVTLHLP